MVATLTGVASHAIIEQAVTALRNLDHRGASGADPNSGDGAGIMTQIPDAFLRDECDFVLPAAGRYAVGTAFLPADPEAAGKTRRQIADLVCDEGLRVVGWREVPTRPEVIGPVARDCMPSRDSALRRPQPRHQPPKTRPPWSGRHSAFASA